MAADKAYPIIPLHHIPLNQNKDIWCVSDMSLMSLDKIVLSGCKQKSKKTFINVFSVGYPDPDSKPKSLYSKEFNKKYTSELWRLVAFLDDFHLVTCFDDLAEKISIKKDKTVQSWKLPQGGASCISVKEREVFIGFSESCDVIVLNSNLRQIRTVTLDALQDGWPVDLVVVPDTLLICSVCCVPRRALAVSEKDGELLREYTNPRSDDSVPLSLTVSAEADLVAVLWNSPPQLTIHSFSHGHCLVAADVEPAERVRSLDQNKLVMVDEKGEMKVLLLEQILTFDNLKAVLSLLLVDSDCRDIRDLFGMPCGQKDKTECSDSHKLDEEQLDMENQRFLTSLEESGNISPGNVTTLLEALKELDKSDSLISPVEAYQKYSGHHRGRKRTRRKSPRGRKDDHLKRKKITEDSSSKNDKMDDCTTEEGPDCSDTKQDSTDDTDKETVTQSSEQIIPATQQDTSTSPSLNECKDTPQLSEMDVPSEKDTEEIGSSVEEDSEVVVMETAQEENVTMEQGDSEQRSNDGSTVKERMVTMLGEIKALKQQNELILSLLRTQPIPYLYPQQHSYAHQCSQHPPTLQSMQTFSYGHAQQFSHVKMPTQAHSHPLQQAQAPTQGLFHQQIGLTQMARPSHPPQSQLQPAVQPSQAPPTFQPTNPLQPTQPINLLPQMQFTSHHGAQIPPCTCKVPPPPATNVLAQPLPVSVPPRSTIPSSHQPSNASLPTTPPSKSDTCTLCTPTRVSPPAQHTITSPQPSYPPALVPIQPNPHMTFQPSVPFYAYHHPLVPPYIAGPVPTGSHIQFAPYPTPQLAPSLPQGPGQPATNLPSQVSSQTVTIATGSQQIPTIPSTPISVTPSSQATNVQPPSQHGAAAGLPPTESPSSNVVLSPYQQPGFGQSSVLPLWQSLPQNVQGEISHLSGSDDPKARDRIARRLIRHFFTSEVRVRSNCTGVHGYAALDPEKLYQTRSLVFYLCPIRSGTVGAEAIEWKRLIKVIDSFNRNHRRYANTKMTLMNGGSDQASVENTKS